MKVPLLTARTNPISTSQLTTIPAPMTLSSGMNTPRMARSRPGKTGQSSSTPSTNGAVPTGIPPMTAHGIRIQPMMVRIIILGAAGSSAGTIPSTMPATQVAGMIPTTMKVIGMARLATMRMSMSTRRVSGLISTILGKARIRSTRSISRTIRRPRRRNLMMSLCARAGTRSSLLPTTEFLSGTTVPPRRILSLSHSD
jgi:hypothetical protein